MAKQAKLTIEKDFQISKIDKRIYGSFIEHLGRAVYGGIWQPGHPTADEDGFRRDVLDLVRELQVPIVRYPGGNFVSNFYWEDSVGPVEDRPKRLELAWRSTEPNYIGINEFAKWAKKADTQIMQAVNLGTRGIEAACNLLEYCNHPSGTKYSDLRVKHGVKDPHNIKVWCLGNEMDGPWQVGHMSPEEYASAVDKVAHAMKLAESGLELVACGSSGAYMPTFGTWEKTVLTKAYENLDFVSCHAYYFDRGHKTRAAASMQDFLASSEDMTKFIATVSDAADQAREANNGTKDITLSFDEWGVWYSDKWNEQEDQWKAEAAQGLHHEPWPKSPHLLEDIYTAADAVVEGSLMITLLKHCDRVRSASRAQLVNVIAPIMTEENGPAWKQTIFYPYLHASKYGRGIALNPALRSSKHDTKEFTDVDDVVTVAVWDDEKDEVTIFAVNRDLEEDIPLEADLRTFEGYRVLEHIVLENDDMLAVNTAEHQAVLPKAVTDRDQLVDGILTSRLGKASWNVIRLGK